MLDTINLLLNNYEVFELIYKGPGLSWNDIYAGGAGKYGWKVRKTAVDKYKVIFNDLIQKAKLPWFQEYALVLQYHSRHDPDNVLCNSKILLDALKQEIVKGTIVKKGYCYDDGPEFCKMVTAVYDDRLPNNTFIFKIIKIK